MYIGYSDSCTTPDYDFFNGLIYGIKVWSRTLSAGEVQTIAKTGIPLSTNGLYNAVMLNEGSGTTIHDSLTSLTGRVLTAQWSLDTPTLVTLIKAVKPSFANLSIGTNYQLQVSGDLTTWTNQGSPFTATNASMIYPQYWMLTTGTNFSSDCRLPLDWHALISRLIRCSVLKPTIAREQDGRSRQRV